MVEQSDIAFGRQGVTGSEVIESVRAIGLCEVSDAKTAEDVEGPFCFEFDNHDECRTLVSAGGIT